MNSGRTNTIYRIHRPVGRAPFTALHSDGLDGVFSNEQMVEELLAIVDLFKPAPKIVKDRGYDIP